MRLIEAAFMFLFSAGFALAATGDTAWAASAFIASLAVGIVVIIKE